MPEISAAEYCVYMKEEIKTGRFWRDCIAELVGTFLLVTCNLWLVQQSGTDGLGLTVVAIGMIFAWSTLGYIFADFGGGQMNNAITFAALIRREISLLRALFYWIMQAAGASCAAFFKYAMTPPPLIDDLANTVPGDDVEWWQAVSIEAFVTTILCFTYLGCYLVDRKGYVILASIPTGMAYGVGIYIATPFSGGSLSSVRSLGPALAMSVMEGNNDFWEMHWIYWAGPMAGALNAGLMYWVLDIVDVKTKPSPYDASNRTMDNRPLPVIPNGAGYGTGQSWSGTEMLNKPRNIDNVNIVNGKATEGQVSAYSTGNRAVNGGCSTGYQNYT